MSPRAPRPGALDRRGPHPLRALIAVAFALALGAGCSSNPLPNGHGGHAGTDAGGGHAGTGTGGGGHAGTGAGGGHAGTGAGGGGHAGTGTGGGGHAGTDASCAGQAGTGAGGSAAGGSGRDDCHSDADCPQPICGSSPRSELLCALGNDGFHHCTPRTPPGLDACPPTGPIDCCHSDADCTAMPHGHCIPYAYYACVGAPPIPGNQCRYDACTSDADCTAGANGVCSARYPRVCRYSVCRTNLDCTAGLDGLCVLADVGYYCVNDVVFCRYSTDPCATNADCGNGRACLPKADFEGMICTNVGPPPP